MKELLPHFGALLLCGAFLLGAALPGNAQTQYLLGPDSQVQPDVPQGETFEFTLTSSPKYFGGAKSTVWVYVPREYSPEKAACVCVGTDGPGMLAQTVFDNLIFKKQMPVTIGVFVSPGAFYKTTGEGVRTDRSYQYDSINDHYARFLVEEVLPAVETKTAADGRAIRLSKNPNDRMIYGGSSGAAAAFTVAWLRPDLFRRVFSAIGTFVGMRGADTYSALVRKTEPKPIRLFLQDGTQDNSFPQFGNWWTQNIQMEESLTFAGYDVNHVWGDLGHEGTHATSVFPDAVKWLWRDYPQPIESGVSGNGLLNAVLARGENWQRVAPSFEAARVLASNAQGEIFFADHSDNAIRILGDDGKTRVFARAASPIIAGSFVRDGHFIAVTQDGKIVSYDEKGVASTRAQNIVASHLCATQNGDLLITEPGAHDDIPSKVWRLKSDGTKVLLDSGFRRATGIAMTPDGNVVFIADGHTHWVYQYLVQPDGTLGNKQRYFWLHTDEGDEGEGDWSDARDIALDASGNLFIATRMGVQIGDGEGRVAGILTLPHGAVTSLRFGGADLKTLYIVCDGKIYRRAMAVAGAAR